MTEREDSAATESLPRGYGSIRAAALGGARRAIGIPALVLGSSFLGFGALVHQAGFGLWAGIASTATAWALPGQVAMLELYAVGAPLAVLAASIALVNARLLPMTITLMPAIRGRGMPRWAYYLAANWIAVTAWAAALRECPNLPENERLPFFFGMSITLWVVTLATTAIGYALAGAVPLYVTLGLVFLNPIYFMLVFAADVHRRPWVLALLFGGLAGPLFHLLSPDWGLLLTGLVAGTAAFGASRVWRAARG